MNLECPHSKVPQSDADIPRQFLSLDAYSEWSKAIEKTVDKIKLNMYPGVKGVCDLDDPLVLLIFSPTSWFRRIQYYILFLAVPVLLEEDRLLLEIKNSQIKRYINLVSLDIKKAMLIDRGMIVQAFALMERAREKLRKKFPGYPLEHKAIPVKPALNIAVLILAYISWIFPACLTRLDELTGWDLSSFFNFLPTIMVPAFSKMAAISLKPVQTTLLLSYCFYFLFIAALIRYKTPPLIMKYNFKKFRRVLYFNLAVSIGIVVPTYLYPNIWYIFFNGMPYYSPFILIPGMLSAACTGELLGILVYKLKHQSD